MSRNVAPGTFKLWTLCCPETKTKGLSCTVGDKPWRVLECLHSRSRIHEHTISLRFLEKIWRVLRLEVSEWFFYNHREGGMVSIRFSSFLLFSLQKLNWRNCKRLQEFEEIEIARQAVEVTVNSKEENSSEFCLDFVQEFGLWSGKTLPNF